MKNTENVDTSKIHNGDIVKNYIEMCKLLNEPIEKGTSGKKVQIAHWERFFSFEKSKQKFIITNVYDKPMPKKLFNRQNKYANDLSNNLLMYFRIKGEDELFVLKNSLMLETGMCNNNYRSKKLDKDFKYEFTSKKSEKYNLNEFYKMSNSKLTSILNSSLNALQRRSLLRWEVVFIKKYEGDYNVYPASVEEEQVMGDIIYHKLKEYECESEYEVALRNKGEAFYKEVQSLIKIAIGCDYYYKAYHIILYNIDNVDYEIKDRISKKQFNLNIIDGMNSDIDNKVENNYEKLLCDMQENKPCYLYPSDFTKAQKEIVQYMISIQNKK